MKEFELLQEIYAASTGDFKDVTIGPSDDMGEILVGNSRLLCGTDQLIVGKHVAKKTPPESIGRKAIARSFSDIAAMVGAPIASLMTACLPTNTDNEWAIAVFEGAREAAKQWGGPIIGGDIASSDDAPPMFTVTALAVPPVSGAIVRSGAVAGDILCVTGELGNANAVHHLTFSPRIEEAQTLLEELGEDLHAMIDISDGLGQDASHLASDLLQLTIDTGTLPLRAGATIENAIRDGEDYELLFTTARVPDNSLVTIIGKVIDRGSGAPPVIDEHGNDLSSMGWKHT